ncbi:MAG: cyanophycin synthetase, partial [Pandoraea sp.]
PAIAESISRDKDLTKQLLESCGVPVPEGRLVESADDAWEAAEDIGLPVVVKPYDGNHGRGVFINLTTRDEVTTAFDVALEEGNGVIVERFVTGLEHRLLVVGGRVVAAAMGELASVVGDGKHTVSELIELQINSDPRRGSAEDQPLNRVRIDSSARLELKRQGFDADSVPPEGKNVLIQRIGNVAFDVTDRVHPSVAAHASLAARIVGLDIAGVDLVAEDISRPLAEQRGAIVEVNAGPGLLMHLKPADGTPRPVGRAIVDHLFPDGDAGRIPIVGITGTNGKTVTARLLTHLLQLAGEHTGLACSDGLFLDKRLVQAGDRANWDAAHRVLMNASVTAAVFENDSTAILSEGLAYDRCQVGIVTNIDRPDHLGQYFVEDVDRMFSVLRTQIDVVLPDGVAVLNARDPLVVEMAELCDGDVIFFGLDEHLPAIVAHRAAGKRVVFVRNAQVVLATGSEEIGVGATANMPLTYAGRVDFQVENVLAAVAAAWSMGVALDVLRTGVTTFDVGQVDAPGRFTLFEKQGATVIVDDAHNAPALTALAAALATLPAERRIVVYGPGVDRMDEDLQAEGRLLAQTFDRVVLCDDLSVERKRPLAESRAQLRTGIDAAGRKVQVTDAAERRTAVEAALAQLVSGDLLVLQADEGGAAAVLDLVHLWMGQPMRALAA